MKLQGKKALVTGASRGIGKAIALELAQEGADVAVVARTVERKDWIPGTLPETVAAIEALGRKALAVQADLTSREDLDALVDKTIEAFGQVDILVNNAAFFGKAAYQPVWELSVKSWDLQIALNLTAPFIICHALAPRMRDQGGGLIINVTSGSGNFVPTAVPGVGYPASKAGLNRMSLALARDMREANIPVIILDPGFTRTEIAEIGAAGAGMSAENAHPVDVPAKTAHFLATCPDPMWYSGKIVVAAEFVREHNLLPDLKW